MLGAIAGDIIGSVYEHHRIKTTEFPLFQPHSRFTDDTVLTIAIASAILEGAAILNRRSTDNNRLFLTLLGRGAFGNATEWIIASIKRALMLYKDWNLEVAIVSYRSSKQPVRVLVDHFRT